MNYLPTNIIRVTNDFHDTVRLKEQLKNTIKRTDLVVNTSMYLVSLSIILTALFYDINRKCFEVVTCQKLFLSMTTL